VKVTVLDDYQRAFEGTEAIQRLRQKLDVQILTEKLPTEEALIHALKGVQAIIPVRERTKFPASLIQALTDLEFISQTKSCLSRRYEGRHECRNLGRHGSWEQ
jgi:D-3-phosphoglycerate dehydrogenase